MHGTGCGMARAVTRCSWVNTMHVTIPTRSLQTWARGHHSNLLPMAHPSGGLSLTRMLGVAHHGEPIVGQQEGHPQRQRPLVRHEREAQRPQREEEVDGQVHQQNGHVAVDPPRGSSSGRAAVAQGAQRVRGGTQQPVPLVGAPGDQGQGQQLHSRAQHNTPGAPR